MHRTRAWKAVEKANSPPFLFRHGVVLSRIERDDKGAPFIRPLDRDRLRYHLARVAFWYRPQYHEEMGEVRKPARPPIDVVRDMLARPAAPVPLLTRIVNAPVCASDGTLLQEPGYHEKGGLLYEPARGLRVAAVPDAPAPADIARARALLLDELLVDFPFIGAPERAHAVALLLLPFPALQQRERWRCR